MHRVAGGWGQTDSRNVSIRWKPGIALLERQRAPSWQHRHSQEILRIIGRVGYRSDIFQQELDDFLLEGGRLPQTAIRVPALGADSMRHNASATLRENHRPDSKSPAKGLLVL